MLHSKVLFGLIVVYLVDAVPPTIKVRKLKRLE